MQSYISLIGLIFIIHLLAVMSPGPDFVLVLRNALKYNRKTAVYTALGIALGIAVHVLYSVAGVAYILQHNKTVFNIVKVLGALYIIYLGIKTYNEKFTKMDLGLQNISVNISIKQAIQTGFITNVLNPKASLFFLSIFSLIIPYNTPRIVLLFIAIMLIVVTFLWFTIVSYIFTHNKILSVYNRYEKYFLKFFGIVLIILGISVFFEL